jgi:hypothetical protein
MAFMPSCWTEASETSVFFLMCWHAASQLAHPIRISDMNRRTGEPLVGGVASVQPTSYAFQSLRYREDVLAAL